MQVHLDTPRANLNAGGCEGKSRICTSNTLNRKNTPKLMICNGIAIYVRNGFGVGASGMPNTFNFRVRLSETDRGLV